MEKLRSLKSSARAVAKDRKARIALSVFVATGSLTAIPQTEGKTPYVYAPIPSVEFQPLVLRKAQASQLPVPLASPMEKVKKLTKSEIKIAELKTQSDYWFNLAKNSGKFSANLLADLHANLPFQIAAGEKYDLSWIVLFVMQQRESGGSAPNSQAFDSSRTTSRVQGSYQIDIGWSQDFRDTAFKGLEYVLAFRQRHQGDAVDTATAAKMLYRNIKKVMDNGMSYEDALFKSVAIYCGQSDPSVRVVGGEDEANIRLDMIDKYTKIFADEVAKEKEALSVSVLPISRFRSRLQH